MPAVVAAASNSRICCRYIPMTKRPAINEPNVWDKMSDYLLVSISQVIVKGKIHSEEPFSRETLACKVVSCLNAVSLKRQV